jgi:hypothetical protein
MSGAAKARAQLLRDWVDFRERFSEHVGGDAIYDVVPYAVLEGVIEDCARGGEFRDCAWKRALEGVDLWTC